MEQIIHMQSLKALSIQDYLPENVLKENKQVIHTEVLSEPYITLNIPFNEINQGPVSSKHLGRILS